MRWALMLFCWPGFAAELANPTALRDMAASHLLTDLRWPDFSDYATPVEAFYEPSDYALAWTSGGKPTAQAKALIESFKNAGMKGLDPEDYDGSRWAARVSALETGRAGPLDIARLDIVRFDLALTVTVMRFASDLHVGRWNPGLYHAGFDIEREHYHLAETIRDRVKNAADARAALDAMEPPFSGYRRTEAALRNYLAMAASDDGEQLPAAKKPVEPGQPYPGIPRLTRLLLLTGDLPAGTAAPENYSGTLVEAVKRFQGRHGLNPDGRLGKDTLAELNVPLSRRGRQLGLTLERWRWVPHDFSRPPIVVNIPEFELRALNDSYQTD